MESERNRVFVLQPLTFDYIFNPDHWELTSVLSLLTRASRPSLDTFDGRLTAGASGFPSSSDTNCTTMFGDVLGGSGSGSGTP